MLARCFLILLGAALFCSTAPPAVAQTHAVTNTAAFQQTPGDWSERRVHFLLDVQEALYSDTRWDAPSCTAVSPCLYSEEHKIQLLRINESPPRFAIRRTDPADSSEDMALAFDTTVVCLEMAHCAHQTQLSIRINYLFVTAKR